MSIWGKISIQSVTVTKHTLAPLTFFSILRFSQDFDGSVVKTSPSIARGAGSIPSQGANIPHASGQETKT